MPTPDYITTKRSGVGLILCRHSKKFIRLAKLLY